MKQVNYSRIEKLQQLKQEIRGSKKHLVIGIDIAKENNNAFFGTATGQTLFKRLVFENNSDGFSKFLEMANAVKANHGLEEVVIGMEPTANYHKPLGEHLIKCGDNVVLVSSNAVKKNRELLDGRWDKHDTKDSANVADLMSQGKCLYYDQPSVELRNLRSLLSLRRKLKKQEHSIRMRIRNHLLAQYFPELDRYFSKGGEDVLSVIKLCLNPSDIVSMEFEKFAELVTTRKKGIAQQKRLKQIWDLAVDSVGCETHEAVDFEARILVDRLKQIRKDIENTDDRIQTVCLHFKEHQYLLSIPAFGPVISAMVLGAIGDPFRFTTCKQLLKLVGLDLSASRSGRTSQTATPSISKKGKTELRYALYQAALIASSKNRDFINYFTSKLQGREKEKGIKTKVRTKLSAKMLIIAWTLMKKREFFDSKYLNVH